jgi:hypothetical protein
MACELLKSVKNKKIALFCVLDTAYVLTAFDMEVHQKAL